MIHINGKDYLFAKCTGYVQRSLFMFTSDCMITLGSSNGSIQSALPHPRHRRFLFGQILDIAYCIFHILFLSLHVICLNYLTCWSMSLLLYQCHCCIDIPWNIGFYFWCVVLCCHKICAFNFHSLFVRHDEHTSYNLPKKESKSQSHIEEGSIAYPTNHHIITTRFSSRLIDILHI